MEKWTCQSGLCSGFTPPAEQDWVKATRTLHDYFVNLVDEFNIVGAYCEFPQYFADTKGHAATADGKIYKLSYLIGAFSAVLTSRLKAFSVVEVNTWKGQKSKLAVISLIKRRLPNINKTGVKTHGWDAVGIGLYCQGYFTTRQYRERDSKIAKGSELRLETYRELSGVLESKDKFDFFYNKWSECEACPLGVVIKRHKKDRCICDYRTAQSGHLDVLFVGKQPTMAEAKIGESFVSRGNIILRQAILTANPYSLSYSFMHATACYVNYNKKPKPEEILTCFTRIEEYCKLTKPRCIVGVGKTGKKIIELIDQTDIEALVTTIRAPGHLLGIQKTSPPYKEYVLRLQEIFTDLIMR